MSEMLIIALAALFGLYRLFYTHDTFAWAILFIQVVCISLVLIPVGGSLFFIPEDTIAFVGLVGYLLSLGMTIVYGSARPGFSIGKRVLIIVSASMVLLLHFSKIQDYPEIGFLELVMAVPIVCFVLQISQYAKNYRDEIGFLVIIVTDAALAYFEFMLWLIKGN